MLGDILVRVGNILLIGFYYFASIMLITSPSKDVQLVGGAVFIISSIYLTVFLVILSDKNLR